MIFFCSSIRAQQPVETNQNAMLEAQLRLQEWVNNTETGDHRAKERMAADIKIFPNGKMTLKTASIKSVSDTFNEIKKLPEGLVIEGNLYTQNHRTGLNIPDNFHLNGSLILKKVPAIKFLGNCHITRDCTIQECSAELYLPKRMTVDGNFRIYCSSATLHGIEQDLELSVGKSLKLKSLSGLTSLTGQISAGANLSIAWCARLRSIDPSELRIANTVKIKNCNSFTGFINDFFHKFKTLYLWECRRLTKLPICFKYWGQEAFETGRARFHIMNYGTQLALSKRELQGIIYESSQEFKNLDELYRFFSSDLLGRSLPFHRWHLSVEDESAIIRFMYRYKQSLDYKTSLNFSAICQILKAMDQDSEIRDTCIRLMNEGIGACRDLVTSNFDQMLMIIKIDSLMKTAIKANKSRWKIEQELKMMALACCRLEELNSHVIETVRAAENSEHDLRKNQPEVLLKYKIACRDLLSPAVTVQANELKSPVTQEELDQAREHLLQISPDSSVFQNFLAHWYPWIRYQRSLLDFDKLPVAPFHVTIPDDRCPISLTEFSEIGIENLIIYNNKLYSAEYFLNYLKSGDNFRDPTNEREPIDISKLYRLDSKKSSFASNFS